LLHGDFTFVPLSSHQFDITLQAQTDPKQRDAEEAPADGVQESGLPPTRQDDAQAKLHQRLRSVQLEIDAVASTIGGAKPAAAKKKKSDCPGSTSTEVKKETEEDENAGEDAPRGGALQQALASERLRSLKKAKAQIQREISQSEPGTSGSGIGRKDKVLAMLVDDEPRRKKALKLPAGGPKKKKSPRRLKTVAYDDDNDFDAVLDGASAGFMETVSH
jgi:DNA excision repair protein ERCC-6